VATCKLSDVNPVADIAATLEAILMAASQTTLSRKMAIVVTVSCRRRC
jgi:hypothetical protein